MASALDSAQQPGLSAAGMSGKSEALLQDFVQHYRAAPELQHVAWFATKGEALRFVERLGHYGILAKLDGPHDHLATWGVIPLRGACRSGLRVGDQLLVCQLVAGHGGGSRHEQREPWGRYRWDKQGNVSVVFTTNNGGLEAAERKRRRIYRPKPDRRGR